jgi:cell division protein FtsQ
MQITRLVCIGLLLIGLIWTFWDKAKTYQSDAAPIRYVRIEGVFQYISKEELKQTVKPLVTTGIFSADMRAIQQAMMKLPWIANVRVKRVWPDAIDIKVYEKMAAARWGENGLLSMRGEIFRPSNTEQFENLPKLYGPEAQAAKLLEIMRGLRTTLADHSFELAEFIVNERRAWKIVLTNGMEIQLGGKEQLRTFQRFLKTLSLLNQGQIESIAKVDLRYPNGYAVTWKPGVPEIDWKMIAEGQQQP